MDQADALAARDFVALLGPRNDSAREHPGEHTDADFCSAGIAAIETEEEVLVMDRGFRLERAEKLAGAVFVIGDFAAYGRVLHMNINN